MLCFVDEVKILDNEQLQRLTEMISLQYFGKPFRHQATFNRRLRTVGGRYLLGSHNIELNFKHFQAYGEKELVGIIKHELCHYHLHLEGKGYMHRDADFRRLLEDVGAPRFCTPLETKKQRISKIYLFQCQSCKLEYKRKRNLDVRKYVCGKCRGKLQRLSL